MVAVAQLVESRIVIPVVVGSSPISHPIFFYCKFAIALLSQYTKIAYFEQATLARYIYFNWQLDKACCRIAAYLTRIAAYILACC